MRLPVHRYRPQDPADETIAPAESSGIATLRAICAGQASQDLLAQIAKARRDARGRSAQTAMLLRSWMSDHE